MERQARLFSLLSLMERYDLGDLTLMLSGALAASKNLVTSDFWCQPIINDEYCKRLASTLDGLAIMCERIDPDPSLIAQLRELQGSLESGLADRRESVLAARLKIVLTGVQNNLQSRTLMFIPSDEAEHYENPLWFGEAFTQNFSKQAVWEAAEAGNCYAAARWTACVFHCMRVAEYGLRTLARKVGAKIADRGKRCPLEYGDWEKVITAIRNKIAATRTLPNGPRKQQRLQFYSDSADQCSYMKDIWRNEISHARRNYEKAEALGVMNRVRDFVQLLAVT